LFEIDLEGRFNLRDLRKAHGQEVDDVAGSQKFNLGVVKPLV